MATSTVATAGLTDGLFRQKPQSGVSGATVFARSNERPVCTAKSGWEFQDTVEIPEALPKWFGATLRKITELLQLAPNWDGYGASEVRQDVAAKTLTVLWNLLESDSPTPNVVPLSDGGIQVEWHRHGCSLELEFPASGAASFYYYEEATDKESEGILAGSVDQLRAYTASLA
ncbi:MAG: hypothetical protein IT170_15450 [Bryobacterales bacterium]|nr:hypothetical protein [Bryobacterales bacterium]